MAKKQAESAPTQSKMFAAFDAETTATRSILNRLSNLPSYASRERVMASVAAHLAEQKAAPVAAEPS